MSPDLAPETWFALADAAVLAAAGAGYLLLRGLRTPTAPDVPSAFAVLEESIGKYAPGIPRGYSWGEAFRWLRDRGVKADWKAMEARLEEYERFRYGGSSVPESGKEDVLRLSAKVRRSMIGKRSKR